MKKEVSGKQKITIIILSLIALVLIVAVWQTSITGYAVSEDEEKGFFRNIIERVVNFFGGEEVRPSPTEEILTPKILSESDAAALAEANNMHVLGDDEFLLFQQELGESTGTQLQSSIQLNNGQRVTLNHDKPTQTSFIEKIGEGTFLVAKEFEANIHKYNEFNPSPQPLSPNEKIDSEISERFAKNPGVSLPVIIRFELPYERFYKQEDTPSQRTTKQAQFNSVKSSVNALLEGNGNLKRDLKIINAVSANINEAAFIALERNPLVKNIAPDLFVKALLDESPNEINAPQVWPLIDSNGNPITGVGMRIAIIDTGVDYTHPDLGGCFGQGCKVVDGWDFVTCDLFDLNTGVCLEPTTEDSDPMDDDGHGTHVAATAAGNGVAADGTVLRGIAFDADIVAYRVLNKQGVGLFSWIIAAIERSSDPNQDNDPSDHVDVASMSLGGPGNPDDEQSLAVDASTAVGVVYTIAAGNSGPGPSTIGSPGTARTAITVAAACKASQIGLHSRCDDPIASFSSRGPVIWQGEDVQKPDIAAPGVAICAARRDNAYAVTCFDDRHVRISGTSMATPHIAGAAALVRQAYPGLTPGEIKTILKITARDLEMSYDDQGAGLADLVQAIPQIPQITVNPLIWQIPTDPTIQLTSSTNTFTVTSNNADINAVDIGFDLNVPGITFSSDKTTLNLQGQSTDTFQATITVNNDQVSSGFYLGKIRFTENNELKGFAFVSIEVKPTIVVSPTDTIDYGFIDPSVVSWTSEIQPIAVTNLRTDISQTVTLSLSGFPILIELIAEPAQTQTIPPGGSIIFNTVLSVQDNPSLPFDSYSGKIEVSGAGSTVLIIARVIKFYELRIEYTDPNPEVFPYRGFLECDNNLYLLLPAAIDQLHRIFFPIQTTCDVRVRYGGSEIGDAFQSELIIEDILIETGSTTVQRSRADANRKIQTIATDELGNQLTPNLHYYNSFNKLYLGFGEFVFTYGGGIDFSTWYMSDNSHPRYDLYYQKPLSQPAEKIYVFHSIVQDVQADQTFANAPDELTSINLQLDVGAPSATSFYPAVFVSRGRADELDPIPVGFFLLIMDTVAVPPTGFMSPATQTIFTNSQILSFRQYSNYWGYYGSLVDCSLTEFCPTWSVAPDIMPFSKRRLAAGVGASFGVGEYTSIERNIQYNGLGPTYFNGRFENSESTIFLGTFPVVIRQDFAIQNYLDVVMTVWQDGIQVASTVIPGYISVSPREVFPPSPITLPAPGQYEAHLDFNYEILQQNLAGKTIATFDTTLSDPNPPAIERLYYFANGVRSEVYDPNVANRLEFEFDPIGGVMSQASASYSTDGINFIPLTITESAGNYATELPSIPNLDKITLRIEGIDSSGNSLEYTFELPTGIAQTSDNDNGNPTVDITSPLDGSTVLGIITVDVSASDDVGIDRVLFFIDGANFIFDGANYAVDFTSPYSSSLDTTTFLDGDYELFATAIDVNENFGQSNPINIIIENPPPGLLCDFDSDCNDNEQCTTDLCISGECSFIPVTDGIVCTDGANEGICQEGVCKTCTFHSDCSDNNECTVDLCINAKCLFVPQSDIECNAGMCQDGVCIPDTECTSDLECNDNNQCTDDVCNAGTCENNPNTVSCGDGDACNGNEVCSGGSCQVGTPVECPAGETCDPATGICEAPLGCTFHSDCADDNECTANLCINSQCIEPLPVEDGTACTGGTCQGGVCVPAEGCSVDTDCDDTNACTTDICTDGTCSNTAIACDDGLACTADSCDITLGCQFDPIQCPVGESCVEPTGCEPIAECNQDSDCDDTNACTTDVCSTSGTCSNDPISCNDGNQCTTDSCNPASGCQFSPVQCNPGFQCNPANGNCEDTTPPLIPTLLTPTNGQFDVNPIDFDWTSVSDPSGVTYRIQVDDTILFLDPLEIEESDLINSQYQATLDPGTHYWHVKAIDNAGNEGIWTDVWSFEIQGTSSTCTTISEGGHLKNNNEVDEYIFPTAAGLLTTTTSFTGGGPSNTLKVEIIQNNIVIAQQTSTSPVNLNANVQEGEVTIILTKVNKNLAYNLQGACP